MFRVLFRISVLSAVVMMCGAAMVATTTGGTDAAVRTLAARQMTTDPPICLLINGVWHCWDVTESDQSSSRSVPSSS